jgi:hypothetical protein
MQVRRVTPPAMAPDRALHVSSLALAATPATAGVDCMAMVLLSFSTLSHLFYPQPRGCTTS